MDLQTLMILLVAYQFKHFICDFPLQTPYMLGKFKGGNEWIKPLMAHAGVHAAFTYFICGIFLFRKPHWYMLALTALDFIVHFTMDRIKASPELLGKYKTLSASEFPHASNEAKLHNKYFWWALGVDQMVHHLTHYYIIYQVMRLLQ